MSRSADRRISFTAKLLISLSLSHSPSLSPSESHFLTLSPPIHQIPFFSPPAFSYSTVRPPTSTLSPKFPPLPIFCLLWDGDIFIPSHLWEHHHSTLQFCARVSVTSDCLTFCFWSSARPFRHSVQLPFSFVLFSFSRQKSNGKKKRWKWSLFLVRWSDYWESVWCGAES